ncbi:MAG: TRAP transporter small permease [Hyphomicrobiales bacterium]|nr:TRAP transporter small permease [Hyphomicrobiales bacterium]
MRILDRLEETIVGSLIAAATLLIFVAVLHRYGADLSIKLSKWAAAQGLMTLSNGARDVFLWVSSFDLSWAQELCIFMFVWMAKFGAAYGVRTGVHVGVDIALQKLHPGSRHKVIVFGLLCGALFTFVIGSFGAKFVRDMYLTGQQSNDLEAPMWLVYLAIPCGSLLMCFRFLQVAYNFARTGELPHTDESHVEGIDEVENSPVFTEHAHAAPGARP